MQPGLESSQGPQLPELVTDPSESLQSNDHVVWVAGREVLVPGQPAAVWLDLLMGDIDNLDLDAIFPGLADQEGMDHVDQALINGVVNVNDVQLLTLELLTLVAARPWWVTMRMVHIAKVRWSILGGTLIMRGVDATQLSLSAWLDALWLVMFDHLPHEKWAMVSAQIEMPPPGQTPKDPMETLEMSTDQFTSLMRG